jgi:hypothetical protein
LRGKQFCKSTEGIPGVKEGVVSLVGLSKNSWIVRGKEFLRRMDRYNQGAEEGMVELVGLS